MARGTCQLIVGDLRHPARLTMNTSCVNCQRSIDERTKLIRNGRTDFKKIMLRSAAPRDTWSEFIVRWYLIHTKPTRELAAETNLLRQGYQVYHPRLLRPTRVRGRWVDRITSLFPRYLFLRLAVGHQSMGPVRSTLGVANIVRFGYEYAIVPDAVVESLRVRAHPHTGLHRLNGPSSFEPGSNVRIVAGVFEGLEGVFQRESGDERVLLLLGLLGRDTLVQVPAEFVLTQVGSQARSIQQQPSR
jgi:transcriptional antiterminator RfaH